MFYYIYAYFYIILSNLVKLRFSKEVIRLFFLLAGIFFVVFIGLRYQVGGDWYAYLYHYQDLTFSNIFFSLLSWDPGYVLFEYISKYFHLGIYGVNMLCAITFLFGFFKFIRTFNIRLSFALLVAFPYLMMVAVMGYSRQGVAVGLVMWFYSLLYKKEFTKALFILLLAALFHKTAIIAGSIIFLNKKFLNFKLILFAGSLSFLIIYLFWNYFEGFYEYYFLGEMQSSGGVIRIGVNTVASILLIFFSKKWQYKFLDYKFWKPFAILSFLMVLIAIGFHATTVADRLLLYFYPLQIIVFYRVLFLIKNHDLKALFFLGVIVLYGLILIVWLLFAAHRLSWIPYDNLLFRIL